MPDDIIREFTISGDRNAECKHLGINPVVLYEFAVAIRVALDHAYATQRTDTLPSPHAIPNAIACDLVLAGVRLDREFAWTPAVPLDPEVRQAVLSVGTLRKLLGQLPDDTPLFVNLAGAVRFDKEIDRALVFRLTDHGLGCTAGEALTTDSGDTNGN